MRDGFDQRLLEYVNTDRGDSVAPRVRWRRTTVSGRPVRYAVGGSGPVVLFLHGWGLGGQAYRQPLAQLVSAGIQVVAPALPGFGGTAAMSKRTRTLTEYGRWVGHFANAIRLERPVTLVGHSFGGGVAVAAAYRAPDLAERLVLVNSIGGSAWVDGRGLVQAIRDRPVWDWGLHLPADLLPRRQVTRVLPVILRDAVPNVLRNPVGVWEVARIARTANLTRELNALANRRLPIFVVWSLRDNVIPMATTMSLRAALGEPRTITVPGGHAWLMDDPRSFGEIITNVVFEAPEGAPSIGDMDADGRATGGHQCGPA
ncbi:alpha/beta fold hydrolase [Rhodococcus sp. NPDC003348]